MPDARSKVLRHFQQRSQGFLWGLHIFTRNLPPNISLNFLRPSKTMLKMGERRDVTPRPVTVPVRTLRLWWGGLSALA